MTYYSTKIRRMQALGAALAAGILIASGARALLARPMAAQAVEAKVMRAQESGTCMIPAWKEPRAIGDEPEPVVLIERDLRVDVPLIRGVLPVREAQTVGPAENTAQDAQTKEPSMRYLGRYKITGYDTCAACCGKTDGITASGTQATVGRTCAAAGFLPFGTRIYIDGLGERTVEDRGGGVNGQHIDVLCADHAQCYQITGWYDVYILED